MKNRVKGLLALCLAMCMVLAMTTVAFGVDYTFGDFSDSAWKKLNVGDTVKVTSVGCGISFYVVDENGKYLNTANTTTYGATGQGYSSASEALTSPDRSYFTYKREEIGIVYDIFTLPTVGTLFPDKAAGYHYEAKAKTGISEDSDAAATVNNIDKVYASYDSSRYLIPNALMLKAVENSKYTVTFELDGGSFATTPPSKVGNVKWTDKVLAGVTDPTKEGFTFNGWKCDDKDATAGSTYGSLAVTEKESITLVAQWMPEEQQPTPPTPTHQHTRRQPAATTVETPTTTVASPKTFDAGVAVYGVMAALSLTGTAAIIGKKKKF